MLFTLNKEVITIATQTANKKLSKNVVIKILFCLVFHLMVQADGDDFVVGKTRDLNRTMFLGLVMLPELCKETLRKHFSPELTTGFSPLRTAIKNVTRWLPLGCRYLTVSIQHLSVAGP